MSRSRRVGYISPVIRAAELPPRPRDADIRRAIRTFVAPPRAVLRPLFRGLEHIPEERPLLFVGNHTLFGVLDVGFLWAELYEQKGIVLRGLGDHLHFQLPVWRDLVSAFGAVDGTRENCAALMRAGETVLVFPGGAREVAKRKGERYKLVWKERLGFARLAARHGCTIVPFSAIGVEDAFDIVYDADDLFASPLGAVLKKLRVRRDAVLPIARGVGGTPLPRPERLYFQFGAPIPTASLTTSYEDDAAMRALRDRVRGAVQAGIDELLELRERDPDRALLPRLLAAARDASRR